MSNGPLHSGAASGPPPSAKPQSQRIYEILRKEILEFELPPGAPLSESELARRLGGSRTPVREAIRQLSHEGLAQVQPGRGAFVAEISLRDIVEVFEMREALETAAARLAARSGDRSLLAGFEAEFLEFNRPIGPTNSAAYYELIGRLDDAISKLCGNRRLARALVEVWSQVRRLRHLASSDPARLTETLDEHLEIVRAVLAGDEEKAGECVRGHVRRSAENIFRILTSRASQRFITLQEPM